MPWAWCCRRWCGRTAGSIGSRTTAPLRGPGLKGRPLGLTPMYLQDEQRMQGLVYLLSLALRLLSLLEWVVRERLSQEGCKLQGVYAGQPGRKTARPSAELLLATMKAISVSVVEINGRAHALLAPLTDVQKRLL